MSGGNMSLAEYNESRRLVITAGGDPQDQETWLKMPLGMDWHVLKSNYRQKMEVVATRSVALPDGSIRTENKQAEVLIPNPPNLDSLAMTLRTAIERLVREFLAEDEKNAQIKFISTLCLPHPNVRGG